MQPFVQSSHKALHTLVPCWCTCHRSTQSATEEYQMMYRIHLVSASKDAFCRVEKLNGSLCKILSPTTAHPAMTMRNLRPWLCHLALKSIMKAALNRKVLHLIESIATAFSNGDRHRYCFCVDVGLGKPDFTLVAEDRGSYHSLFTESISRRRSVIGLLWQINDQWPNCVLVLPVEKPLDGVHRRHIQLNIIQLSTNCMD